jgi:hypothetical protein
MCFGDDENTKTRKKEYTIDNLRNPNFEGMKVDNQLADGPFEKRKFTDICCCIIFIVYCVGMVYVAIDGQTNGTPKKLTAVYDGAGKLFLSLELLMIFKEMDVG